MDNVGSRGMVGTDDLKGLFQTYWFNDSMKYEQIVKL